MVINALQLCKATPQALAAKTRRLNFLAAVNRMSGGNCLSQLTVADLRGLESAHFLSPVAIWQFHLDLADVISFIERNSGIFSAAAMLPSAA